MSIVTKKSIYGLKLGNHNEEITRKGEEEMNLLYMDFVRETAKILDRHPNSVMAMNMLEIDELLRQNLTSLNDIVKEIRNRKEYTTKGGLEVGDIVEILKKPVTDDILHGDETIGTRAIIKTASEKSGIYTLSSLSEDEEVKSIVDLSWFLEHWLRAVNKTTTRKEE